MKSSRTTTIQFNILADCTKSIVKIGTSFSYLSAELNKFLPTLAVLLETKSVAQQVTDLMIISYLCCTSIAVEHRYEVCLFIEKIAKYMRVVFRSVIDDANKELLFKFMDLAIIVHYPLLNGDKLKMKYIGDVNVWHRELRNFKDIMEGEMKCVVQRSKYSMKSNTTTDINQIAVKFAARLSYLIFWDESIWFDQDDDDVTSSSKRPKVTNKLGTLMDYAQPRDNEFNWKWIAVIAELMFMFPDALENQYFQPLLTLLSNCQATIENSHHIYAFARICCSLLDKEEQFISQSNSIVINLYQEMWKKVCDATLRSCASSNKLFKENHFLLQILLNHQKNTTSNFIEEIIKMFSNKTIVRCDATLRTLIELMMSFNLDTLENGSELTMKILQTTFENASVSERILAAGTERPSAAVRAEVGAMCCLSKTDVFNFSRRHPRDYNSLFSLMWSFDDANEYGQSTQKLVKLLLVRSHQHFIIEDEDFQTKPVDTSTQQISEDFKCITLLSEYEELFKLTEFKAKIIDETKDTDEIRIYIEQVLENSELMMCLSNSFLKFEAFNQLKFNSSFTTKKIAFNIQQINRLFGLILTKRESFELREKVRLLTLVKLLFVREYHDKVCEQIRAEDLGECLKWVALQFKLRVEVDDDERQPYLLFGWKEFKEAKFDAKIKYLAIETLCHYNHFDGTNTHNFVELMTAFELIIDDNVQLHAIFEVINILGTQKQVHQEVVDWIWDYIMEICKEHNANQYISSQLIGTMQSTYNFTKNYPRLVDYMFKVYKSFMDLVCKSTYNPEIAAKMLNQVPSDYTKLFYDEEQVSAIFNAINGKLLKSSSFEVRLSCVKVVANILSSDIEQRDELSRYRTTRKENFENIMRKHAISDPMVRVDENADLDQTAIDSSTSIQLFTTLFVSSYLFRNPVIIELSKTLMKFKQPEEVSFRIFDRIIKFLKCDPNLLIDDGSLRHLLICWILNAYTIDL